MRTKIAIITFFLAALGLTHLSQSASQGPSTNAQSKLHSSSLFGGFAGNTTSQSPSALPSAGPGRLDQLLSSDPKTSTGELFRYLSSQAFTETLASDSGLPLLTQFFAQPQSTSYSRHDSVAQNRMTQKIGVLAALRDLDFENLPPKRWAEIREMARSIATNPAENWVIQRGAVQVYVHAGGSSSEEDRDNFLAQVNPRVIALARLSDDQLAQRLGSQ